jgi:hypothetical protein
MFTTAAVETATLLANPKSAKVAQWMLKAALMLLMKLALENEVMVFQLYTSIMQRAC